MRRALPGISLLFLSVLAGCATKAEAPKLATAEVRRSDLSLTVSADGVIEPVRTVEVKSKSSGEVVSLGVETGSQVAEGEVLLQLSPKDARNLNDQASADEAAATSRLQNAEIAAGRARRLHAEGLLPLSDVETAELAVTSARTDLVRAQKNLENARERLAETTVRSPIAGTIIGKHVEVGQVISSAVSQVSGGTLLFTLADLGQVHVRSLVDEVDIGQLRPGQPVTIRLEAFPGRQFQGELVKIEPKAVVEQNVTMFPVLTFLENPEGLLKPGMNAEVEVLIAHKEQAVAVPNEALKSAEDARAAAELLGITLGEPASEAPAEGEAVAPEGDRPRRDGGAWKGKAGDGGGRRTGGWKSGGEGRRRGGDARRVVLVARPGGFDMRFVTLGLRTWDMTEVVSGIEEGDHVALVPSLAQLRQSARFRDRIRESRGMPGMGGGGSRSGSKG